MNRRSSPIGVPQQDPSSVSWSDQFCPRRSLLSAKSFVSPCPERILRRVYTSSLFPADTRHFPVNPLVPLHTKNGGGVPPSWYDHSSTFRSSRLLRSRRCLHEARCRNQRQWLGHRLHLFRQCAPITRPQGSRIPLLDLAQGIELANVPRSGATDATGSGPARHERYGSTNRRKCRWTS